MALNFKANFYDFYIYREWTFLRVRMLAFGLLSHNKRLGIHFVRCFILICISWKYAKGRCINLQ